MNSVSVCSAPSESLPPRRGDDPGNPPVLRVPTLAIFATTHAQPAASREPPQTPAADPSRAPASRRPATLHVALRHASRQPPADIGAPIDQWGPLECFRSPHFVGRARIPAHPGTPHRSALRRAATPQRRVLAKDRPPPAARNFAICPSTTAAPWGPKPRSDPGIPRRAGRCSVILRCMAWASLASCHCTAMACEPRGEGLYARAFGRKPRLCYHMAPLVIYRQRTDRRVTSKRGRTTHTLKDSCLLLSASTSLGTITSF